MQYLVALASLAAVAAALPGQKYTMSTVYKTNTYTVTHCGPEVTNCPAESHHVTTEVVPDYTTVCPVTETETPPAAVTTPVYTTAPATTPVYSTVPAPAPEETTCTEETETAPAPVTTPAPYTTAAPAPAPESTECESETVAPVTPPAPGSSVYYSTGPAPAPAPTGTGAASASNVASSYPMATGAAHHVAGSIFGGAALVAGALLL